MTFKEKKLKRMVEDYQDLDEKTQQDFIDTVRYNNALSVARDLEKTKIISFGELYDTAKDRQKFFNKFEGFGCGLEYFDNATMGFRPGELTILAGPSNFGKTMVALNILTSVAAETLKKVLFISLEMTPGEVATRVYNLSKDHDALKDNFYIQAQLNVSAEHIKSMIESLKPDIVMVDHLGFVANRESGSEYERINSAMHKLKRMSLDTQTPMIVISHVSKSRSGSSGEATNADLKGSSSIEQDADITMMINRPAGEISGNGIILTLTKHRTKKPVVLRQDCLLTLDGIKIANDGKYSLYS